MSVCFVRLINFFPRRQVTPVAERVVINEGWISFILQKPDWGFFLCSLWIWPSTCLHNKNSLITSRDNLMCHWRTKDFDPSKDFQDVCLPDSLEVCRSKPFRFILSVLEVTYDSFFPPQSQRKLVVTVRTSGYKCPSVGGRVKGERGRGKWGQFRFSPNLGGQLRRYFFLGIWHSLMGLNIICMF